MMLVVNAAPAQSQNRPHDPSTSTRRPAVIRVATRDSSVLLSAVASADSFLVVIEPAAIRVWADDLRHMLAGPGIGHRICEGYEGACDARAEVSIFSIEDFFSVHMDRIWLPDRYRFDLSVIRRYPANDTLSVQMSIADVEQFIHTIRRAASEADSMRAQPLAHAFEADSVDTVPVLTAASRELLAPFLTQMLYDRGVLEVIVTPQGRVESGSVQLVGLSKGAYDLPLKNDAQKLRFTPGEHNGRRVRVRVRLPLAYPH